MTISWPLTGKPAGPARPPGTGGPSPTVIATTAPWTGRAGPLRRAGRRDAASSAAGPGTRRLRPAAGDTKGQ
jgi:hypothetical protein